MIQGKLLLVGMLIKVGTVFAEVKLHGRDGTILPPPLSKPLDTFFYSALY